MDTLTREESQAGPWEQHPADAAFATWVWDPAVGDDLHQQDTEGPDVGLDGEGAKVDGFRGCPLDGELGPCGVGKSRVRESLGSRQGLVLAGGTEQDGTAAHICALRN